jgi:hypothetical protein
MIHAILTSNAMGSLLHDLKTNGVVFALPKRTEIFIEDTPKGRLSIKLVKERFGVKSIKIID